MDPHEKSSVLSGHAKKAVHLIVARPVNDEDGDSARSELLKDGNLAALLYAVPCVKDEVVAKVPYEVGSVLGGIDNGVLGLCLNHGFMHHVVPTYDLDGNNTEVTSSRLGCGSSYGNC